MNPVTHFSVAALACASTATISNAQTFNIDFSSTGAASAAPSSAYGAAAGQAGTWNNFTTATVTNAALLNTAGSATGVTLSLTAGGFMFDGSTSTPNGVITSRDDALFMDDVWDSPALATISVNNLAAGTYQVYAYGGSPDSGTTMMNFSIGASGTASVGGQWSTPFTYQPGITHAVFSVTHAGGNLVINVPEVAGFESVNGLQIVGGGEPPCPEDTNGDSQVNVTDLLAVIGAWGACTGCPADVNDDGLVNVTDLLAVIGAWGPC